jgi:regulator of sirC expression with transglutaminase-like and TPR domain
VSPAPPLAVELQRVVADDPLDLARAALVVARLEYPDLDPAQSIDTLDRLGDRAGTVLRRLGESTADARISALNRLLYDEERFSGNRRHYDDFRNSCLNAVLERRLGIPITLALVYMEVARRAGLAVLGVGFPGHFLMRVPTAAGTTTDDDLILDPFNGGMKLNASDCVALLHRHDLGSVMTGEGETEEEELEIRVEPHERNVDLPLDRGLLRPCSSRHMLARMLNNLKRTYVELRSFPQARLATEMLLVVDPTLLVELRDRGLLNYHLDDFPAALRDLEAYLRLASQSEGVDRDERKQIWEHVKNLRRRVAGMN